MTAKTLIIRADASSQMGAGHVMRCLALAEPWLAAGSHVILVAQQLPESLAEKAKAMGITLHPIQAEAGSPEDASATATIVKANPGAWLVVDGYQFDTSYQQALKAIGTKMLLVDDFGHAKHYCADYVLNQNLGVTPEWYPERDKNTRLLLGTRYVQLRGEFLQQTPFERDPEKTATHVLVTLGGSDPDNVTAKVITALPATANIEATVVIGGSNPHWKELDACSQKTATPIRLIRNASNMPELMTQADLAIAAGGTTAWELAFSGVPMMTIVLADNQKSNGEQLAAAGVSINLGWHGDLTPESLGKQLTTLATDKAKLQGMAEKAWELVDGLGSMRVWLRLNEDSLKLRPVTMDDARLILDWANEAGVRAVSFSSEPILWENHLKWFDAKLSDTNYHIWVAEDAAGTPIGQVRFEIEGEAASISISLDASQRGKNRGGLLIWAACRKLFAETAITKINAYIKPDNKASTRAFEKVGFQDWTETTVKNLPAWVCSLERSMVED